MDPKSPAFYPLIPPGQYSAPPASTTATSTVTSIATVRSPLRPTLQPRPRLFLQPAHKNKWPEGLYISPGARFFGKTTDDVWRVRSHLHSTLEELRVKRLQHAPPAEIADLREQERLYRVELEFILEIPPIELGLGWTDEQELGWHWTNRYWAPGTPMEEKARARPENSDLGVPIWFERGLRAEYLAARQKRDDEADKAAKAVGNFERDDLKPKTQARTELVSEVTRAKFDAEKDELEVSRRFHQMVKLRKEGLWQTVFGTMWRVPPGLGFVKLPRQEEIEFQLALDGFSEEAPREKVEEVVKTVREREERRLLEREQREKEQQLLERQRQQQEWEYLLQEQQQVQVQLQIQQQQQMLQQQRMHQQLQAHRQQQLHQQQQAQQQDLEQARRQTQYRTTTFDIGAWQPRETTEECFECTDISHLAEMP